MADGEDAASFAPVIRRLQRLDWVQNLVSAEDRAQLCAALELVMDGFSARRGFLPAGVESAEVPGR